MLRDKSNARTGDQPSAAMRALRLKKGMTLVHLSEATGRAVSTLSKLENDKMSFTYDKLVKIASGMGVDIAEIFSATENTDEASTPSGRRSIAKGGEGRVIETANYVHTYLATDLLKKRFVPIYGEVKARSIDEFGEMIRHPGEEFVYVLEGAVELHTALYAPVLLEAGESMYFDSSMAHAYIAAAKGPCRMLSICSGSESDLIAAIPSTPADGVREAVAGHPAPIKPGRTGGAKAVRTPRKTA